MRTLKRITSGIFALVLAMALAGPAVSQTSTSDVTVEITSGGTLSASITDWDVGSVDYQLEPRTPATTMTITASDMRGTAGGWTVTLSGTDFEDTENAADSFSIANLRSPAGAVHLSPPLSGHPTNTPPVASAADPVSNAQQTVLSAVPGTGAGHYTNERAGTQLTIPGGTLVGEYKSTLTVTITGNDPGDPPPGSGGDGGSGDNGDGLPGSGGDGGSGSNGSGLPPGTGGDGGSGSNGSGLPGSGGDGEIGDDGDGRPPATGGDGGEGGSGGSGLPGSGGDDGSTGGKGGEGSNPVGP